MDFLSLAIVSIRTAHGAAVGCRYSEIDAMKILEILFLLSVARNVSPRRHKVKSSSGESIENLLFYQDCKHTTVPTTTTFEPVRLTGRQVPEPSCPFPKMCCAMSCNNEPCVSEQLNSYGRQIQPNLETMSNMQSPSFQSGQGQVQPVQRARKKKFRPPPGLRTLSGRRDFGFTKERIKSLISHDDDIRKILKDLVRVTMQKVDLQEMINSRRNAVAKENAVTTAKPDDGDMVYDEDE